MNGKIMKLPIEALEPQLITRLRNRFVQQEPTARRLLIASGLVDDPTDTLGRSYLDQALSMSAKVISPLLKDVMEDRPEPPEEGEEAEPDHRIAAAYLFLYGVSAGYWAASPEETELARAVIITTHGKEALEVFKPEKTKDDLAREAGVPNKTFTYRKRKDNRASREIVDDYLRLEALANDVIRIRAIKPLDWGAYGNALRNYFAALSLQDPEAYQKQFARLRDACLAALKEGNMTHDQAD
jgi:hypothetical protein